MSVTGATNGKPNQENARDAGLAGLAVCRDSLGLGYHTALEECPEALSISSGGDEADVNKSA